MHWRIWPALLLLAKFAGVPLAECADAQTAFHSDGPALRIETGMHTATIGGIDVDAGERFLVTASDDKTARVWDLKDGRPLQVLRPPQGAGNEGKLYAIAISPDGTTVAVAGWTGPDSGPFSVYLFDRARGTLTRSIPGLPSVVSHLSYSTDGRYLAVSLAGPNGVRVYRSADYSEAARDSVYGDACYWAEFDRAGRLVTASDDGFIRLYDEKLRLTFKGKALGNNVPISARFSPDGSKVAVGFEDTTAVSVLSGRDLSFLSALQTPPLRLRGKPRKGGLVTRRADAVRLSNGRDFFLGRRGP
jgi:WD40 repeat protein